jgi:tryptophanyl-tRNA synthetase
MKRLVSGIKPTGPIQLGNYLGAIKNWVELQKEYDCFFFIADLHALTIDIKPGELKQQTHNLIIDLLSLGINPKKSVFFRQSDIIGHAELAWIFNCLMPVAELNRMTQFKEESQRYATNINAGLLTYPSLQAADILIYKGEVVPVGEDQLQHLELTRVAARKFNNRYQKYFPEIKPILSPAARLMSLSHSDKKMSKSLGEASYIAIRDDAETITKKIKKAVTDETGVKNLLQLYSYFGKKNKHLKMEKNLAAGKLMNAELKEELTKEIIKFLTPIQRKIALYEQAPQKVDRIIKNGAKKAQKIASNNITEIKKIIGF